jgi:hypothetical protein
MGLAKPGATRRLMGKGPGLARIESVSWVFGLVWNRPDPFVRSKPGMLAGYQDLLLTLMKRHVWNDSEQTDVPSIDLLKPIKHRRSFVMIYHLNYEYIHVHFRKSSEPLAMR